jgi:acetolactate synthase-1/2/3 large subunit
MSDVKGGHMVAKALIAEGVSHVFTLASGEILPICDTLFDEGVKVINVRHEQAAGNMADGWGRVTRTPGVAIVAMGPGIVNSMPALAQASFAGSPVVTITGCVPLNMQDRDAFEDIDTCGYVAPYTKWARKCIDSKRLPEYVGKAFTAASSGKMGPVLLEAPKDILLGPFAGDSQMRITPSSYRPSGKIFGDPESVRKAIDILIEAKQPAIIAGSGVYWAGAEKELVELAEMISAPVACEYLALGCIPMDNDLFFGNAISNFWMRQADAFLVIGARLDNFLAYGVDPSFYPEDVKLIHVDIDSSIIGKNRSVDVGIVGDARAVLSQMIDIVKQKIKQKIEREGTANMRQGWLTMAEAFDEEAASEEVPLRPHRMMKEIRDLTSPESRYIIDGGDTTAWANLYLKANYPAQIISSQGPLGHLGAGLPIALAAKLAEPGRPVYLISGDGSFLFNVSELDTAVRHKIPIIAIVTNDTAWGLVYHSRLASGKSEEVAGRGTILSEGLRYDKLAEGFGAKGELVTEPNQIKPALDRALESELPYVIDARVSREYESMLTQILGSKVEF